MTKQKRKIEKIIGEQFERDTTYDEDAGEILSAISKELLKKIGEEIRRQKIPASYEIAHYKMGLEKANDIIKSVLGVKK